MRGERLENQQYSNKISRNNFTLIENYILDSEKLDGMEQIVYLHLKKYSGNNSECFPALKTLCKKLKFSENTIRRVLRSLEAKGVILINHRFNDSNKYELLALNIEKMETLDTDLMKFYKDNINPDPRSIEKQVLISWLNKFKGNTNLIFMAITLSVKENAKKINYIEAILIDWEKNKIETVEQAESYTKARAEKRSFLKQNKQDTFNDYEQRSYDYADLEKKLLGRDTY